MVTQNEQINFIQTIAPIIQEEARKRGYNVCSPVIAQACIESAYGKSSLGYKYHNYFGLKCGSSWKGKSVNLKTKEEYKVGVLTTIKDNFRVYDNIVEGVKGYYDFISTKRYANLKTATSPKQYLEFIKADSYATSSKYVQTNMTVVEQHSLYVYDSILKNTNANTVYPTLKKGSMGEYVVLLQKALNENGSHLTVDGVFGLATEREVIVYQAMNGLKKDGIVGKQTWGKLLN